MGDIESDNFSFVIKLDRQTQSQRGRETETERPLCLFDRLCCQLVSFPGRFIKGRNTKSSEGGRHGGEPNMPFEHIDLASLRFFGERQPECQSERMNPPPSFSYPILPDGKRERERERERERDSEAIKGCTGL